MAKYRIGVSKKEFQQKYLDAHKSGMGTQLTAAFAAIEKALEVTPDLKGWVCIRKTSPPTRALSYAPLCVLFRVFSAQQEVRINKIYLGPPPAWVLYNNRNHP